MEFSEQERLMLVNIKDEISILSKEILENIDELDSFDSLKFSKDLTDIISKITTLSSYAKSKNVNMEFIPRIAAAMMLDAKNITNLREKNPFKASYDFKGEFKGYVLAFISTVNTIEFNFQKKRFSINLKSLRLPLTK